MATGGNPTPGGWSLSLAADDLGLLDRLRADVAAEDDADAAAAAADLEEAADALLRTAPAGDDPPLPVPASLSLSLAPLCAPSPPRTHPTSPLRTSPLDSPDPAATDGLPAAAEWPSSAAAAAAELCPGCLGLIAAADARAHRDVCAAKLVRQILGPDADPRKLPILLRAEPPSLTAAAAAAAAESALAGASGKARKTSVAVGKGPALTGGRRRRGSAQAQTQLRTASVRAEIGMEEEEEEEEATASDAAGDTESESRGGVPEDMDDSSATSSAAWDALVARSDVDYADEIDDDEGDDGPVTVGSGSLADADEELLRTSDAGSSSLASSVLGETVVLLRPRGRKRSRADASVPAPSPQPRGSVRHADGRKMLIAISGLSTARQAVLRAAARGCGGRMVTDDVAFPLLVEPHSPASPALLHSSSRAATHLVVIGERAGGAADGPLLAPRTAKYAAALLRGLWIVDFQWVADSVARGKWLSEEPYEIAGDPSGLGAPRAARLRAAREDAVVPAPLFRGKEFYFARSLGQDLAARLAALVQEGGGTVLQRLPPRGVLSRDIVVGFTEETAFWENLTGRVERAVHVVDDSAAPTPPDEHGIRTVPSSFIWDSISRIEE